MASAASSGWSRIRVTWMRLARAAAFVAASRKAFLEDNSDGIGGRQSEWWEVGDDMTRIDGKIRTSVIVDPANGKMPPIQYYSRTEDKGGWT